MAYKKIVMGIFCFIYTKSILWLTVYLDKFYSCYLDIPIMFRINIGQLTVDSTKCKTIILKTCWLMTDSWQYGNNFLKIQNFKVRLCGLLLFILSENSHILKQDSSHARWGIWDKGIFYLFARLPNFSWIMFARSRFIPILWFFIHSNNSSYIVISETIYAYHIE